ncbi:glycosyltransferase family 4 protein [Arthrobacter sp. StoSoilB5]|uniref:glycosyltransferase family 4 protein n=1 Tax=Arthrobacter sp. StoSoilB5 TaxID=2830992 RepID=UPI001CC57392|nr:glycosyltransferase family 4 protein [Arthrobacter sp. StoSoilB5]
MKNEADSTGSYIFLHSSNEMYGADKILLEVLQSLPERDRVHSEVWLPDDLPGSDRKLTAELDLLAIQNGIEALPVLRRRYLTLRGIFPLMGRTWRTFRALRRSKPELVYCTTSAMVFCLPLAKLAGVKKTVLHLQEIWTPKEAWLLGLAARFADNILCISTAARASLPEPLKMRSSLLTNAHRETSAPMVPHESLNGPLRFLVASRWNSWKGHASLLSAWDTATNPPGDLIILGGPPSMGNGVDVRGIAGGLRHSASISVVGEVSGISDYLDKVDFLVLPSDKPEPFGLVLLESFARGRPVIASRAGGVLDIVVDGANGRLFEMGNTAQLHDILAGVNREKAIALGRQARKDFEERFSIESYQARFRNLWNEIVRDG